MAYVFRKAADADLHPIWNILQQAIARRKKDGSDQWQDGYPNPDVIQDDIKRETGFVMTDKDTIIAYCMIAVNDEPAYASIEGKWLSDNDFVVFHRVAVAESYLGKGVAKQLLGFIEEYARAKGLGSIKADTNFDNPAMMKVFEKSGYAYCGEVLLRGAPRKAYEKVL